MENDFIDFLLKNKNPAVIGFRRSALLRAGIGLLALRGSTGRYGLSLWWYLLALGRGWLCLRPRSRCIALPGSRSLGASIRPRWRWRSLNWGRSWG